mmetsp:Transcript_16603/g.22427  ORF Transcript_16603/g.22427 Transcript_16603/m.22427 type:complete len:143 (-) Transcript_16603:1430-1858(-)
MDTSVTGVDDSKLPPQKTMVSDFMRCKQNFSELKQMIEETQKKGNRDFGHEIISAAMAVREKRDMKKGKKDFVAEHAQVVKNWHEVQTVTFLNRKLQEDVKLNNARYRKTEFLESKKTKALQNLVRWDDYRLRKAEMTELFI